MNFEFRISLRNNIINNSLLSIDQNSGGDNKPRNRLQTTELHQLESIDPKRNYVTLFKIKIWYYFCIFISPTKFQKIFLIDIFFGMTSRYLVSFETKDCPWHHYSYIRSILVTCIWEQFHASNTSTDLKTFVCFHLLRFNFTNLLNFLNVE